MNLVRARSRGDVKPLPGAQVDWGHPLAQDLGGLWIANDTGGFVQSLVNSRDTPRIGSSDSKSFWVPHGLSTPVAGGVGVGYAISGVSSKIRPAATGLTLLWRGVILGNGDANGELIALDTNAGAAPFVAWGFDRGQAGTAVRFVWNFGGTFAGTIANVDASPPTGRVVTYVVRWVFGSHPAAFRDGIVIADITGDGYTAPTYDATPTLRVGGGGSASTRGANAILSHAALWSRPLSLSEIQTASADPYAYVQPPSPKFLFFGINVPPPGVARSLEAKSATASKLSLSRVAV